ncbi:MAG: tetratricopeptide repeat protein [Anaerolineae bacterium]
MQTDLTFAAWLKRKRKEQRLTQETLAGLAGCSTIYLKKIEAGQRQPTRQVVEALLAALRVPKEAYPAYIDLAFAPTSDANAGQVTNLPIPLTSFIGREQELAAVDGLLERKMVRLVTLTGPGGVGKTLLALHAAAQMDSFRDGLYFVNLAPITEPTLIVSTIAQTLHVREQSGSPILDVLKDYLRDKSLLLILDNFEQITDAAPLVSDLLLATSKLKVIVTSRETLRVRGEHEFPVPPLAAPNPRNLPEAGADLVHALSRFDAVRLFIERATAVKPDFNVTSENAPLVAQICYRLDGLPLAIELAAARVRSLPPQAMLQRLSNRLKLLTGGPRDLPARQQTLRGTIEWSYDLLDEGEKALFRSLAVFVGGFTLEAAEAICGASQLEGDILDGVESLVAKSLVWQIPFGVQQADAQAETRFSMLETIREYARERLSDAEAAVLRHQHATYYMALAERVNAQQERLERVAGFIRLQADQDNLRAALDWAVAQGDVETGQRLASALTSFWELAGKVSEGWQWLERMLALPQDTGLVELRARSLRLAGYLAWLQGDYAAARTPAEESAALWRAAGDQVELARALNTVGRVRLLQGESAAARSAFEESVALFRMTEAQRGWAFTGALQGLAFVAIDQEDFGTAQVLLEEAGAIVRPQQDVYFMAVLLSTLGDVARCRGDYERAGALYHESLALLREHNITGEIAAVLHNLGYVALAQADRAQARALFAESLALQREQGNTPGIAECLAGYAALAGADGQVERAARLFGAVEAWRARENARMWPAERIEVGRHVAALQEHADANVLTQAWAEGRTMTLEQAVAYALEEMPGGNGA